MNWLETCQHWKKRWPIENNINAKDNIDLYYFISVLNKYIEPYDSIVVDAGSTGYITGQGLKLKSTNRYICSGGQLDMGFGLPASIGTSLANTKGRTILIVGDGGFQTNIQELAVVRYLNLPIKIFVLNNNGYLSIRNTQQKFYKGNLLGCDEQHGLWLPALSSIAQTYHINFGWLLDNFSEETIYYILNTKDAYLIDVVCSEQQDIIPTAAMKDGKSMPLSQMAPFLSEEEYEKEHY